MTEIKLPVLWSRSGLNDDAFVSVETIEETASHDAVIVPLQLWPEISAERLRTSNIRIGVRVEAGEPLDVLLADLDHIDLLVLDFPAFNDGRSFSKAARLRSHYGFGGEIRAAGIVRIDQVTAMLRAGFDSLQISDSLTLKRLQAGELYDTGVYYQPVAGGVAAPEQANERFTWRRRQTV